MDSKGRSLIGRVGVLKSIYDFPFSYPSSRVETTLVMMDMWPLARVMGFLSFSKIKYLGGDYVSGNVVFFWQFDSISIFQKIFQIWTLWCLSISYCTCEIRFRITGVRTVGLSFKPSERGCEKSELHHVHHFP